MGHTGGWWENLPRCQDDDVEIPLKRKIGSFWGWLTWERKPPGKRWMAKTPLVGKSGNIMAPETNRHRTWEWRRAIYFPKTSKSPSFHSLSDLTKEGSQQLTEQSFFVVSNALLNQKTVWKDDNNTVIWQWSCIQVHSANLRSPKKTERKKIGCQKIKITSHKNLDPKFEVRLLPRPHHTTAPSSCSTAKAFRVAATCLGGASKGGSHPPATAPWRREPQVMARPSREMARKAPGLVEWVFIGIFCPKVKPFQIWGSKKDSHQRVFTSWIRLIMDEIMGLGCWRVISSGDIG